MARRLGIGLALAAALVVGGGLAARLAVVRASEGALQARGVRWQEASHGLLHSEWRGLERGPITVASARLGLLPAPTARLQGLRVQLAGGGSDSGEGAGGGAADLPVRVWVEDATVLLGDRVLAEGLSGSLAPALALSGEGLRIERRYGAWHGEVSRAVDLGPARGTLGLTSRTTGDQLAFEARVPDLVLEHALLAPGPLPPTPLQLDGTWQPDTGALVARGSVGGLALDLRGSARPSPRAVDLRVDLSGPLEAVVALFGPHVPEGSRATCSGQVGVELTVQGPPLAWRATPRAEGLACSGLLVDLDGLRSGAVTWKARSADGSPVLARTGPGRPGFTTWMEGRRVAEAIIATEDVTFPTHGGYDLSAIQEALDEAAAGEARPRGGSTLTQQLAKNLFLDGTRTLARKLRELLYALELEAELDKRHILQLYLNVVELGPDLHGVGAAADLYFAKRPEGLTDKEAAFLASLLPSPTSGHERASRGRVSEARIAGILDNMALAGMRDRDQVERAKGQPLVILIAP